MNKLNTLKLTSITASAALLLSVVFSGSAIAGPGNKKGPQSSAAVISVCHIDEYAGELVVNILITDKSSGVATAVLDNVTVQGEQKKMGNAWKDLGDAIDPVEEIYIGTTKEVRVPICEPLMATSKAINALTSVTLGGNSSKDVYLSRCKDDPATDDGDPTTDWDNEAILKIANFPGLCQ